MVSGLFLFHFLFLVYEEDTRRKRERPHGEQPRGGGEVVASKCPAAGEKRVRRGYPYVGRGLRTYACVECGLCEAEHACEARYSWALHTGTTRRALTKYRGCCAPRIPDDLPMASVLAGRSLVPVAVAVAASHRLVPKVTAMLEARIAAVLCPALPAVAPPRPPPLCDVRTALATLKDERLAH